MRRESLSRIQQISGQALTRNWLTIPHVTNFDHADVTETEALRWFRPDEALAEQEGRVETSTVAIQRLQGAITEIGQKKDATLAQFKSGALTELSRNVGELATSSDLASTRLGQVLSTLRRHAEQLERSLTQLSARATQVEASLAARLDAVERTVKDSRAACESRLLQQDERAVALHQSFASRMNELSATFSAAVDAMTKTCERRHSVAQLAGMAGLGQARFSALVRRGR